MQRLIIILVGALALVATACSSASDADAPTAAAVTTTAPATTTTAAPATTTTTAPATTTTAAPATTTTAAPATTTTTEAAGGDTGPDVDEITLAYEIVFSSETTYEEKAPLIDDPTGLEETVAKYQETGESMGGVGMAAKSVTINGDTADVTYDLLFGGTPSYTDLPGDAVLIDGTWKVTRTMFCSLMTSARVGCP